MQVQRFRARVGSAEIYYEVAGQGPPLVLVHGLCGSGKWWAANVPFLARRYRVYTVDLVGFGRSRCERPFTLAEASATLGDWMERTEVGPAHLAGHSMGGHIAAELAADRPWLVRRLLLVNAAAIPFELAGVPGPLTAMRGLARAVSPQFLSLLFDDAACAGPATIARAARDLLQADIRPKLPRIAAPTLVVWGSHDPLVPLSLGRQLAAAIPGARLAVLPDTGHNPMIERPQTFNRLVDNFLQHGLVTSEAPSRRRRDDERMALMMPDIAR
jgi:pimeloyl-ACP methyl ester carboxylesterase